MTSERTFADELTIESLTHHCNDLRTQLAAAREALSNANERALAYDDELRTLRHRAERERDALQKIAVLQDAWETEAMGNITMLLKERNEYRDRAERMESQIDAVRSLCDDMQGYTALKVLELLDDASAGES